MKIISLSSGWLAANTYLLISGKDAAIVDPGVSKSSIVKALEQENATPRFVLLTHGHFDHLLSMEEVETEWHLPAYIHAFDLDMPEDSKKNAFFQFMQRDKGFPRPQFSFTDGEKIGLGDEEIEVIHTPGHTAGSSCFLCGKEILITGDTLFDGDTGRTDLYSGDAEALPASLRKLAGLAFNPTIYPGHGGNARLGDALASIL